jgi:hypothetical protein
MTLKMTDFSEILIASITRAKMMEPVSTSETSVNFYQTTWRSIPEDSHLYIRRYVNMKSRSYKWGNLSAYQRNIFI